MKHPKPTAAFSLVEVTMAIGIVSFALLSLIALLPSGLQSVRDSANEAALSSIVRTVRGELNQASFSDVTTTLPAQTWYFNESGHRLEASAPSGERFFQLSFSNSSPSAAGAAAAFDKSLSALTLTVRFPTFAPASGQTKRMVTLLAARQTAAP